MTSFSFAELSRGASVIILADIKQEQAADWDAFMQLLSSHYRVIVPNQRNACKQQNPVPYVEAGARHIAEELHRIVKLTTTPPIIIAIGSGISTVLDFLCKSV